MFLRFKIISSITLVLLIASEIFSELSPTNRVIGYYGGVSYLLSLDRTNDRELHYQIFSDVDRHIAVYINSCSRNEQYLKEHGGRGGIESEARESARQYAEDLKKSYEYSLWVWPYLLFSLVAILCVSLLVSVFL